MQIRLLTIGRIRTSATRALVDDFALRLRPYHPVEELELRASSGDDRERAIATDTETILARIDRGDRVWLLDREGREYSSEELAQTLSFEETLGKGRLTVVIGGAYGLDRRLSERADIRWSLSRLTFLHEWARAITLEQLYRAAKILRNEPYHH